MKKTSLSLIFTLLLLAITSMVSFAQYRDQVNKGDYSGPVFGKNQEARPPGNLSNLFNMKMSQSFSMSLTSYGGKFQNIDAFTNSMDFFFTDRLTGNLDVSLMYSPFGNGFYNPGSNNGMGPKVIIRNAELNYQLNDRSHISIQFQQSPYPFGGDPFSHFGYSPY